MTCHLLYRALWHLPPLKLTSTHNTLSSSPLCPYLQVLKQATLKQPLINSKHNNFRCRCNCSDSRTHNNNLNNNNNNYYFYNNNLNNNLNNNNYSNNKFNSSNKPSKSVNFKTTLPLCRSSKRRAATATRSSSPCREGDWLVPSRLRARRRPRHTARE